MPKRKNLHQVKSKRKLLIDEWRCAWRWASVQVMAVIAAAQGLMTFVPTIHEYIPDRLWHAIMGVLAILAILGRVINQGQANGGK